jgi:hypothetical protein
MPIVIAEFLTGSTPLPSLLSPLTLPTLLGLYGAGALLVRELTVKWRKGWPTVFALGCAYGIVEEGLDVKSWFNPHWAGIGILGTYGRLFGVNWVWATELTIFHSVFSITIPVALAGLLYPESSGERWLPGRKLPLVAGLFVLDVLFGFTFTPYTPPAIQYLLALGIAVVLVVVARRLPPSLSTADGPSRLGGRTLFAVGLASTTSFFLIFWVVPNLPVPPTVDVLLAAALCLSLGLFLRGNRLSGGQAFSLICGALGFLIAISILSLTFLQGPPFVGAALALYLVSVRRRAGGASLPAPGAKQPGNVQLR